MAFIVSEYTQAGLSHTQGKEEKPCEDVVASLEDKSGQICVITLCDGCGTAKHAHDGAQVAASVAAEYTLTNFMRLYRMSNQNREESILYVVRKAMFQEAIKRKCDISDFSCTLLVAAHDSKRRAFYLHIGDGLIFCRFSNGKTSLLSRYTHKFYNSTSFVTSLKTRCHTEKLEDVTDFFLISDGPEPFLLDNDRHTRAKLFMQLPHILPLSQVRKELQAFTAIISKNGMYDDASYISSSIKNPTMTFREMFCGKMNEDNEIRKAVFGKQKKQTLNKLAYIFDMIQNYPNGIPIEKITKLMYTHKKRYALKQLKHMIGMSMIKYENGRIYPCN